MPKLAVKVVVLPHGEGLDLPAYQTPGSAGCDVRAAIAAPLTLDPGQRALVPCGFKMAIPEGWEVQVRPRSGLAVRHGITMVNGPGTIDADYRGEVAVPLINLGQESFTVGRGERIAQLVMMPVHQMAWAPVDELDDTVRGDRGFGSTGTS